MADVPACFDKEFFQQIICNEKLPSPELTIIDFEVKPIPAGNNYCSVIYNSRIQFRSNGVNQTKHFVIKTALEDGSLKQISEDGLFMDKECKMYEKFFPLADNLIENFAISPKHFPSKINKVLVLEDLRDYGYVMCNKFNKLDFEHSAMVMKSLASFHAMSVAINKKDPALISYLAPHYVFKTLEDYGYTFMKEYLLRFEEAVVKWKGFEHFRTKIRFIYDTCCDRMYNVINNTKCFKVLNHGDLWINNILFKYGGNKNIEDVKLIDFQICSLGSPGIDLQYFTWTSMKKEVRHFRIDELYAIYRQTLNTELEKLGCDERLTEKMLKEELVFTMFFGFFSVFCSLSVMFSGDAEKTKTTVFDYSCYREVAQDILVYLDNNGFFK